MEGIWVVVGIVITWAGQVAAYWWRRTERFTVAFGVGEWYAQDGVRSFLAITVTNDGEIPVEVVGVGLSVRVRGKRIGRTTAYLPMRPFDDVPDPTGAEVRSLEVLPLAIAKLQVPLDVVESLAADLRDLPVGSATGLGRVYLDVQTARKKTRSVLLPWGVQQIVDGTLREHWRLAKKRSRLRRMFRG